MTVRRWGRRLKVDIESAREDEKIGFRLISVNGGISNPQIKLNKVKLQIQEEVDTEPEVSYMNAGELYFAYPFSIQYEYDISSSGWVTVELIDVKTGRVVYRGKIHIPSGRQDASTADVYELSVHAKEYSKPFLSNWAAILSYQPQPSDVTRPISPSEIIVRLVVVKPRRWARFKARIGIRSKSPVQTQVWSPRVSSSAPPPASSPS